MLIKRQARQSLPDDRERNANDLKPLQGLAAILLAVTGLALASQFISFVLPRTVSTLDIPALHPKLEDIKREGDKYDFVFLGSSRVYRGVNPVEIDAEARKQGCNIKTYNFGIGGLSILEQKYILHRLEESGITIGTIFIEPYSVSDNTLDSHISDRRRYFYTWKNLPDLLLDQSTMPTYILFKARNLAYFLFGFVREQIGVGRLSLLLFPQRPEAEDVWDKPTHRGFRALDDEPGQANEMRSKEFVRTGSKFHRKLDAARKNRSPHDGSGNRFKLVLSVTDIIRDMNMKPGIIIMPSAWNILPSIGLEERLTSETAEPLPIINLNRLEYYGDIFKLDNFFDGAHLNRHGATVAARHLASRLCALQDNN